MKKYCAIFVLCCLFAIKAVAQTHSIDFFGKTFNFQADSTLNIPFQTVPSSSSCTKFYQMASLSHYNKLVDNMLDFKKQNQLSDWLYYQLVRKIAENFAPKGENYARYTLYKWLFMCKSGYDARLATGNGQIIFFIRNDEDTEDIPYFEAEGKRYTCLNYHDYGKLFNRKESYFPVKINIENATQPFSYKVDRMPEFAPEEYTDKLLAFDYKHKTYHFNIKVNQAVGALFKNYPVVNYETYFNIPLSEETYKSLIPTLKQNIKKLSVKQGVDYLMRFTRYAFLYQDDQKAYGQEKRFSPEQTLLSANSDCDDRAGLFFYLVKEIYNLPMIALLYPTHITMAVAFDKPTGQAVYYNGTAYTICEPTPQKQALKIGQLADNLKSQAYQVVYAYKPR